MASTQFSLNAFDWKKILKGFIIAEIGAIGATAVLWAGEGEFDLKKLYVLEIGALGSTLVNLVKKWIAGPVPPPTAEEFNGHTENPNQPS